MPRAHRLVHLRAGEVGHHDVAEDHLELGPGVDHRERRPPLLHHRHLVRPPLEDALQDRTDHGLVVDDQDAHPPNDPLDGGAGTGLSRGGGCRVAKLDGSFGRPSQTVLLLHESASDNRAAGATVYIFG